VRGVSFCFSAFDELWEAVAQCGDGEMPVACAAAFRDGEWVVVTCSSEGRDCMLAGCVRDRGEGAVVAFEPRDWARLRAFAERGAAGTPSRPRLVFRSSEFSIQPPQSATVLLVDDDADVQCMVAAVVSCAGFAVSCVDTAEEALASLSRGPVDLVITARELPGSTGLELCRALRQRAIRSPVMVLTSGVLETDLGELIEAGASDYLPKPFRTAELSARMLSLLRRFPTEECPPTQSTIAPRGRRASR
jgi:CheY-like chemotaxis protein